MAQLGEKGQQLPLKYDFEAELIAKGDHACQWGDYEEAITHYSQVIDKGANSKNKVSCLISRAEAYSAVQKWTLVISDCSTAIKLDPTQTNRGKLFWLTAVARKERALLDIKRAVEGKDLAISAFEKWLDFAGKDGPVEPKLREEGQQHIYALLYSGIPEELGIDLQTDTSSSIDSPRRPSTVGSNDSGDRRTSVASGSNTSGAPNLNRSAPPQPSRLQSAPLTDAYPHRPPFRPTESAPAQPYGPPSTTHSHNYPYNQPYNQPYNGVVPPINQSMNPNTNPYFTSDPNGQLGGQMELPPDLYRYDGPNRKRMTKVLNSAKKASTVAQDTMSNPKTKNQARVAETVKFVTRITIGKTATTYIGNMINPPGFTPKKNSATQDGGSSRPGKTPSQSQSLPTTQPQSPTNYPSTPLSQQSSSAGYSSPPLVYQPPNTHHQSPTSPPMSPPPPYGGNTLPSSPPRNSYSASPLPSPPTGNYGAPSPGWQSTSPSQSFVGPPGQSWASSPDTQPATTSWYPASQPSFAPLPFNTSSPPPSASSQSPPLPQTTAWGGVAQNYPQSYPASIPPKTDLYGVQPSWQAPPSASGFYTGGSAALPPSSTPDTTNVGSRGKVGGCRVSLASDMLNGLPSLIHDFERLGHHHHSHSALGNTIDNISTLSNLGGGSSNAASQLTAQSSNNNQFLAQAPATPSPPPSPPPQPSFSPSSTSFNQNNFYVTPGSFDSTGYDYSNNTTDISFNNNATDFSYNSMSYPSYDSSTNDYSNPSEYSFSPVDSSFYNSPPDSSPLSILTNPPPITYPTFPTDSFNAGTPDFSNFDTSNVGVDSFNAGAIADFQTEDLSAQTTADAADISGAWAGDDNTYDDDSDDYDDDC